jgi:hypothetical protein
VSKITQHIEDKTVTLLGYIYDCTECGDSILMPEVYYAWYLRTFGHEPIKAWCRACDKDAYYSGLMASFSPLEEPEKYMGPPCIAKNNEYTKAHTKDNSAPTKEDATKNTTVTPKSVTCRSGFAAALAHLKTFIVSPAEQGGTDE